jgi:alkanesulfonate monooxygenase SsuD/methylene tetrahydromethanopterin reductase-like flavin-dependent oxidoreductase (luciferase family)
VGASGEQRMLGIVAKHADAWNTWGLPDVIAHKSAVLDQHCEKVGRDPATITRTAQAQVFVGPGSDERARAARMPAFGGTAAQLTEVVAGYAALGLDELIVPTAPFGDAAAAIEAMELLRTEVFPNV